MNMDLHSEAGFSETSDCNNDVDSKSFSYSTHTYKDFFGIGTITSPTQNHADASKDYNQCMNVGEITRLSNEGLTNEEILNGCGVTCPQIIPADCGVHIKTGVTELVNEHTTDVTGSQQLKDKTMTHGPMTRVEQAMSVSMSSSDGEQAVLSSATAIMNRHEKKKKWYRRLGSHLKKSLKSGKDALSDHRHVSRSADNILDSDSDNCVDITPSYLGHANSMMNLNTAHSAGPPTDKHRRVTVTSVPFCHSLCGSDSLLHASDPDDAYLGLDTMETQGYMRKEKFWDRMHGYERSRSPGYSRSLVDSDNSDHDSERLSVGDVLDYCDSNPNLLSVEHRSCSQVNIQCVVPCSICCVT